MIYLALAVVVAFSSSLEEIQNHFMPILTKLEENYDELFDQDTRVKISDLDLLS